MRRRFTKRDTDDCLGVMRLVYCLGNVYDGTYIFSRAQLFTADPPLEPAVRRSIERGLRLAVRKGLISNRNGGLRVTDKALMLPAVREDLEHHAELVANDRRMAEARDA